MVFYRISIPIIVERSPTERKVDRNVGFALFQSGIPAIVVLPKFEERICTDDAETVSCTWSTCSPPKVCLAGEYLFRHRIV